jgi:hypothetical protein
MTTARAAALFVAVGVAALGSLTLSAQPPARVPPRPDQWIWPDPDPDNPASWQAFRGVREGDPVDVRVTPLRRPEVTYLGWLRPGQVCRLGSDLLLVVRGDRHPHDGDSPRAGWKMPDDKGWVWVVRLHRDRTEEPQVRRLLAETVVRPVARCEIVIDEGQ